MRYLSEGATEVIGQCENCNKLLEVNKDASVVYEKTIVLNPPVQCVCGTIHPTIEGRIAPIAVAMVQQKPEQDNNEPISTCKIENDKSSEPSNYIRNCLIFFTVLSILAFVFGGDDTKNVDLIVLAERELNSGFMENEKDITKTKWGNIDEAKSHLEKVPKPSSEALAKKVDELKREIVEREQGRKLAQIQIAIRVNPDNFDILVEQQKKLDGVIFSTRFQHFYIPIEGELLDKLTPMYIQKTKNAMQTGDFDNAEKYFGAISSKHKYSEAKTLLGEQLEARYEIAGRKSPRKISKESAEEAAKELRMLYGQEVEKALLKSMMDVYVTVTGENKEYLRLKYVLWSRPLVLKFVEDSGIVRRAQGLGFKQVYFDSGPYGQHVYYDL